MLTGVHQSKICLNALFWVYFVRKLMKEIDYLLHISVSCSWKKKHFQDIHEMLNLFKTLNLK